MRDLMLAKRSRAPIRVPLLRAFSVLIIVSMLISPVGVFAAPGGNSGFKTSQDPMVTPVMAGVEVTPLLTVGDVLPSGFRLRPFQTASRCAPEARDGLIFSSTTRPARCRSLTTPPRPRRQTERMTSITPR